MIRMTIEEYRKLKKPMPSKYRNVRTERNLGNGKTLKFDSQKEAVRYDELTFMLQSGDIRNLRLQPQFTLHEAYTTPDGERIQAMRYVADFSYEKRVGEYATPGGESSPKWTLVVEDVKSTATKTQAYKLKKKLMLESLSIGITEI